MEQSYREGGVHYDYNYLNADYSMHWYGRTPDYFNMPTRAASSSFTFATQTEFVIDSEQRAFEFDIKVSHRLVSMSIWGSSANHWFESTFKYKDTVKVDLDASPIILNNRTVDKPLTYYYCSQNKGCSRVRKESYEPVGNETTESQSMRP